MSNGSANSRKLFNNFLKEHQTTEDSYTHTSFGKYKNKYEITLDDIDEFHNLYVDHVIKHNGETAITERHMSYGPLLIDIDFRIPIKKKKQESTESSESDNEQEPDDNSIPDSTISDEQNALRTYTNTHIKRIVREYYKCIIRYLDLDDNEQTPALVFEKSKPKKDRTRIKDGVHIIFPEIITDSATQYKIREDVINSMVKSKLLIKKKDPNSSNLIDDLKLLIGNSNIVVNDDVEDEGKLKDFYEKLIDADVINRNPWMMYGSRKENSEAYVLTKVYNMTNQKHLETNTLTPFFERINIKDETVLGEYPEYRPENLPKYLSIRKYTKKHATPFTKVSDYVSITDWYKKKNKPKKRIIKQIPDPDTDQNVDNDGFSIINDNTPIEKINIKETYNITTEARELVKMLKPNRSIEYKEWSEVGWCLHNIDSDRLFNTFITFSKKAGELFDEAACTKLWEDAREDGKLSHIGTLRNWAKEDNIEAYESYKNTSIFHRIVNDEMMGDDNDIATIMYEMYKDKYICSSISKKDGKGWFEYKNHRWRKVEAGTTLYKLISSEVHDQFTAARMYYVNSLIGRSYNTNDWHDCKAKKYADIARKLKTVAKKNNIMTECAHLFYDEDFEEKLDANPNLICCENGVYDLYNGIFRDGMYNDFVSKTTKIKYIPYNPKSKIINQIDRFLSEIQTNTFDKKYLKFLLGLTLSGITPERFDIWSGGGGNGKSILCKLIELALGEYAGKMPVELILSKRNKSSSASPELICLKGVRFVTLSEPDDNTTLNTGLVKELSGNDTLTLRGLFKDQIQMTPQWSIILICNDQPQMPPKAASCDGMGRRLRLLHFGSKFTEHPDPNISTEFKIDPLMNEKVEEWKEAFLSLMIHYNQLWRKNDFKIDEPQSVLKYTLEYQKDNDVVLQFLDQHIEPKKNSHVVFNELYTEFENWYRDEYGTKAMTKKDLRAYLAKKYQKLFKKTAGKLMGYALKIEVEDPQEGNAETNTGDNLDVCSFDV